MSNYNEMTDADVYERYFANCSIAEQAEQFADLDELTDYVSYQTKEHYPEDTEYIHVIANDLWHYMQDNK